MKYIATITIEQEDDTTVDVKLNFDPPLNRKNINDNPIAYDLAAAALQTIKSTGEILKTEVDGK